MTHGTKRAEIDFSMSSIIFVYAESKTERFYAQLFMQRLEFDDLKLITEIKNGPARFRHIHIGLHHICDP